MSASTDARLADSPLILYELNNLGAGVDGETVPDISGNEIHGTLTFTGSQPPWGHASPIETDAASRAFWGYNNAGTFTPPITGVSRIESGAIDADLDADVSVEAWVKVMDTPFPSTLSLCGKGGSFGIVVTQSGGTRIGFAVIDSADALWVVADLTFLVADFLSTWFHVVGSRTGNTLAIRINGELRNTATVTSGLPNKSTGAGFRIHHDNPFYLNAQQTMAALYDHGLSSMQARTHYEADLAASLLSGVSNVIPTAILYSDIEPDPVSFPLRHNWVDSLIERISFRTARSVAVKGYESSNAQRPKPRRELEISQVLRDNDERQSFRAKLTTQQHAKWFIPILEDREQLTTTLTAGSTTMPATTQYRDYEVGGWVELRQVNDATGAVEKHEVALITSLSPLTTAAITNTYLPFISTIGPVRRGILEAQVNPRGHTDAVEEMTLVARLVAEDEKVTPNRITVWTPTFTYKSHEVFDISIWQSHDWTELRDYNVERARSDIDYDAGQFTVESDTLAASESFGYRMLLEGRTSHAALLGWFYARAGALNYLWVPTVQRDFNIVSVAGANLTVAKQNYFRNFAGSEFRRDLAFVYHDNTMVLRRINSVALAGANEVLTLDDSVPSLTSLRSVSYLRFCRLDGDTLEIARVTDTKAYFAWGFREMLSSPA